MSAIDRTLESLFQSFGNGAFGVFIGLLLVVLVATGVIPTIVAASLFGAWLIALVWLARLRPLKGLTVVSRWLIVLIGGMVFAFAANYFGRWALLQVRNQKEGDAKGFSVAFKMEMLNMQRSLERAPLWVLFLTPETGQTISPVALLQFIEITSLYSHPVSISSYSMAIKTETCGWVYLMPIDTRTVDLLWGGGGLNSAGIIRLDSDGLNFVWSAPIPAYGAQFGMLLFDTKAACDVHEGSIVQFKLDVSDSMGQSFSYTSAEISVRKQFTAGNSIQQQNRPYFEFTGFALNADEAYRTFRAEPASLPENIKKGTVDRFYGHRGIVILQDGAFVCPSCTVTLHPAP